MTNWTSIDRNTSHAFAPLIFRARSGLASGYRAPAIDKHITLPTLSGVLSVTSLNPTSSYGPEGGPFSVGFTVYLLKNTGRARLNWTASSSVAWLDLNATSGYLDPGDSINVTATLDAGSLGASAQPYTGSVSFVNTTSGYGGGSAAWSLSVTGDLEMALEARSKSGTATLCGFSEYTSASTPPKKFRTKAFSGVASFAVHAPGTGCTVQSCTFSDTWTGSIEYDSSDCSTSGTGTQTRAGNCGNDGVTNNTTIEVYTSGIFTYTKTATTNEAVIDGCVNNTKALSTTVAETLSNEDTETDAIDRFSASTSFGGWGSVVSKGDGASAYQARTSGFSFSIAESQWKASLSGLIPSQSYDCSVEVYKRAYGTSDPWVLDSTVNFTEVADGSGIVTHSDDTPQASGYEYCVFNAILTVT